ncbi:outer membrane antigenic lipoprotein B [Rodentibacter pneumotropicus]|uniref:Outer membrane antigenic lipoprotein B n=1 Tax=Rodentibacter pneumotropicus TaxID=758 RepID=A0A448MJD3_9PAST|nr:outer membrane antigenic lipoprotein B [Rodentibacter pneumotropicus]
MKKSFLLLPLSVAILSACSSNTQAPIENAGGTLSPGIMQPVDNNSSGTWQPEIQQIPCRIIWEPMQQVCPLELKHHSRIFNRLINRYNLSYLPLYSLRQRR